MSTCLYCDRQPCRCEFEEQTFEVTIWWHFECHGEAVWGQSTDDYTREEIARLFFDLHLVYIQVGQQIFTPCMGQWMVVDEAADFMDIANTECQRCQELCADPWEGFVNNQGDLNWEE